jgi:tripartite-type tricarboxylate transporter receptor subunit TctC
VRKLNTDIASIMKQPDVADPLLKQGAEPQSGTPDDLRRLLDREIGMWGKIIKEANIKAE